MQKTFWLNGLAAALLFTVGCDNDKGDGAPVKHQIPTDLPSDVLRSSTKPSQLQKSQQQPVITPQSKKEIDFDCGALKHDSLLCKGPCEPDVSGKTKKCKEATISKTCKDLLPRACMEVKHNKCMVFDPGTDDNGNPYKRVCVDNKIESCQLDPNADLTAFCQTSAGVAPINGRTVCTQVADTRTCTSSSIDQLCKAIVTQGVGGGGANNGEHCGDIALGLGNIYTKMCQTRAGAGAGMAVNRCTERAANLCTLTWNRLPAAKTQADCENIAILPDGTGVDPIEGAPRATAPLVNRTSFSAGIKPCKYSGKAAYYTPDLKEFRAMCKKLSKDKCSVGTLKDVCGWVSSTP